MYVLVSGDPGKMSIHCSIVDVIVDADHFSMNNHDKRERDEKGSGRVGWRERESDMEFVVGCVLQIYSNKYWQ